MGKRITYEDVKAVVEQDYGLQLLSDEYRNLDTPLTVICDKCGQVNHSLSDLRKHKGCPSCHPLQKKIRGRKLETPRFGTELELWRISHEFSYGQMAWLIDEELSAQEYIRIEAGQQSPTKEQARKIYMHTRVAM